ncbi:hypothetical protein D3C75_567800 [compost metagenome]
MILQALAGHDPGGDLRQRRAGGLGDEGHGTGGTGVHLDEVDLVVFHRELHVHQADHAELQGQLANLLAHLVLDGLGQGVGRQGAGGVTGVDTGLLDVLHDAADDHVHAVADGVHVHLGGVVEEAIQQYW